MGKRKFLAILSITLLFFCTACGREVKDENVSIAAFRHGKEHSKNVDTELLELVETIVTEECKAPRMLSLMLPLTVVEKYKEDGIYIEVVYKNGKSFPIMGDSSETVIDEVIFLIGEEPLNCYVCCDTETAYYTFFLSEDACDKISEHLN